jgi:hypothetical protein
MLNNKAVLLQKKRKTLTFKKHNLTLAIFN